MQWTYLLCLCHFRYYIAAMHFTWNYLGSQLRNGSQSRAGFVTHRLLPRVYIAFVHQDGLFPPHRVVSDPGLPILDTSSSLSVILHPAEEVSWQFFGGMVRELLALQKAFLPLI